MINILNKERVTLSLIVPVYNERDVINLFVDKVTSVFKNESNIYVEIIFINDGSTDETLNHLIEIQKSDSRLRVIDLSRNFGKEAALSAGLDIARGEAIVPIDVDLQDPPELIMEMLDKWREGYEVVLGRRIDRKSDGWAKRTSATLFYSFYNKLATPRLPENVGDFRLMDRRVVEEIKKLPESNRFMKGLFAWVGFKTISIDYVRPERVAGITKFNGLRLWSFALEGLTSFSAAPMRMWMYLGFLVAIPSVIFAIFVLIRVVIFGADVPGYASIIVAITLLGSLQLIGIGVIGEYISGTYSESKRRPIYIISHIFEPPGK